MDGLLSVEGNDCWREDISVPCGITSLRNTGLSRLTSQASASRDPVPMKGRARR
jgi:hypothetical protein